MTSDFITRAALWILYLTKVAARKHGNGIKNPRQMFAIPAGLIGTNLRNIKRNWTSYEIHTPKPRFVVGTPEEIRFVIPACGFDTAEIKMSVNVNNRFILIGKNSEMYCKQYLDLPTNVNFETADFKARLDNGLVYVGVTNFQKKERVVSF